MSREQRKQNEAKVTESKYLELLKGGVSEGCWPGDAEYENGQYLCECMYCGEPFIGHKRRIVCKLCSTND